MPQAPVDGSEPDSLRAETVAALMPPEARRWFDLRVVASTESTNSDLLRDAHHLPSGTVLAAHEQTAGRGRRGRAWIAPPGGSLAFSVLWKFRGTAAGLSGLSLAVGVAVARALEQCGLADVRLKWPNDLLALCEGRWCKLGGILIELTIEPGGATEPVTAAVIGIGINLDLGNTAARIDQAVTDLRTLGSDESANAVLAAVLVQLAELLPAFASNGFAPLAAEWNQRHAWRDAAVLLFEGVASGAGVSGIARGVAEDGALLIETPAGLTRVLSGDVSLRVVPA